VVRLPAADDFGAAGTQRLPAEAEIRKLDAVQIKDIATLQG
jgi:hypothetical protein